MPLSHYFSRYFYGVTRDVNKAKVRCKWAVFDFSPWCPSDRVQHRLQETCGDPSLEDVWRAEWGGEILFAHGFKYSKGVMTLFKPSLNVDYLEITVDKNGRFLVANININQDDLCLVNIYAPNYQNQQVNFFDKIIDPIRQHFTWRWLKLFFDRGREIRW